MTFRKVFTVEQLKSILSTYFNDDEVEIYADGGNDNGNDYLYLSIEINNETLLEVDR